MDDHSHKMEVKYDYDPLTIELVRSASRVVEYSLFSKDYDPAKDSEYVTACREFMIGWIDAKKRTWDLPK